MDPHARPLLAPKARLRPDPQSGRVLLLYPERGLLLNPTAEVIVRHCTGQQTVTDIVAAVARTYRLDPDEIRAEVGAFLDSLAGRGLLRDKGG